MISSLPSKADLNHSILQTRFVNTKLSSLLTAQNCLEIQLICPNQQMDSQRFKGSIKPVARNVQLLGYDRSFCMVFGIYGALIEKKDAPTLLEVIRRIIEEGFFKPTASLKLKAEGVTFVLLDKICQKGPGYSKNIKNPLKFSDFKSEVVKGLSVLHLTKINHIVGFKADFLTRSWNYLTGYGLQSNFYQSFYESFQTLQQIEQFLGPLFQLNKIDPRFLEKIQTKSCFSQNQKARSLQQLKSFETHLMDLQIAEQNLKISEKFRYQTIDDFYITETKIGSRTVKTPLVFALICEVIKQGPVFEVGIFRTVADLEELNGYLGRLIEIEGKQIDQILKQSTLYDILKGCSASVLSGLIKKILNEIKIPLVPEQIRHMFLMTEISQQSTSQSIEIYSKQSEQYLQKGTGLFEQQRQNLTFRDKLKFFENLSKLNKAQSLMATNQFQSVDSLKVTAKRSKDLISHHQKQEVESGKVQKILREFKSKAPTNFCTFEFLLRFLKQEVIARRKYNKMDSRNIAICFAPCLFRKQCDCGQSAGNDELKQVMQFVDILQDLLENCQTHFNLKD